MEKKIGHLSEVSVNITEPFTSTASLTMNEIVLLVGSNGSGKTFFLIQSFALSFVMGGLCMGSMNEAGAQYVYDNCFDDQNIDGTVSAKFGEGEEITICFEKGKVISLSGKGYKDKMPIRAIYMSSGMRLFTSIRSYLLVRSRLGSEDHSLSREGIIAEMVKDFKLYDVCYIEMLLEKMPVTIDPRLQGFLAGFDEELSKEIKRIEYDPKKCDFYAVMDGKSNKYLTTFGNGHQAIINMMLANA